MPSSDYRVTLTCLKSRLASLMSWGPLKPASDVEAGFDELEALLARARQAYRELMSQPRQPLDAAELEEVFSDGIARAKQLPDPTIGDTQMEDEYNSAFESFLDYRSNRR
jgi:hypothetical protein